MDPVFFQLVRRVRALESESENDSIRSEQIMGELENASDIYGIHLAALQQRLATLRQDLAALQKDMHVVVMLLKRTASTASVTQLQNRVEHLKFSELLLRREMKGLVEDLS